MCSDASLFFSYQVARDSSMMMENGSHASVRCVSMVDRAIEGHVACPYYQ
jgi:hypothetical protein